MPFSASRRELLIGGAATALSPVSAIESLATAFAGKRTMRVAHMSDFHAQPELNAPSGMRKSLQHLMSLKPRPSLILGGGDLIMDSFAATEERTALQWKIFSDILNAETKIPFRPTMGNHDVWGWNKNESKTTGNEAKWGDRWFCDQFGLTKAYYSFDMGRWHFVVLNNILQTPDGYNGLVDPEQMEWLASDLKGTKKPTLILTHIPIMSITPVVTGWNAQTGDWKVGGNLMNKNADELRELFKKNPHVKIALSGHMHMVDRVDYLGVSYMCGGAVSGNWWRGDRLEFKPGYRVLDLADDGTFTSEYVAWGWKGA